MLWLWKWSLALLVFIAVMAAAGYYVFLQAVERGEMVTVPNITNMPLSDAYATLARNKLLVGEPHEVYSADKPASFVIAQSSPPGKVVRAGRKVYPTVNIAPEDEATPELIGLDIEKAKDDVGRTGRFELALPPARIRHTAPPGTIIGQDPAPGLMLQRGGSIRLLVSEGNTTGGLPMADLTGMTNEDATALLHRNGLTPVVIETDRPDAPVDKVCDQDPKPGTLVAKDAVVKFWIRPSGKITGAWREVQFTYTVPYSWSDQEVRIDIVNKEGKPWTAFPQRQDYGDDGKPPRFGAGTPISIPLSFQDQLTVEVYLNGKKVKTSRYEGDAPPIEKDYLAEGDDDA